MTSSIHSVQEAHSQAQTEQAVQPPKTLQTQAATQNRASQDTVTISQEARQALTHSTTQAGGGGPNDYGDKH
ncbi:MAG TPA: hypothetical protein VK770_08270 [Candidatus Acidoferrum sp.]|jgi:hypothetical protein|nr:hypothetical protein [Candidatus Acidoferrum sp.]